MQSKNKKYKITNPTRRTYIVQGHKLKCNESIYLDEIKFTEPSLVVEEIQPKQKSTMVHEPVVSKKKIFVKDKDYIGE